MKKSLNLMWRFKWIPLLTLLAETLLILPVFLLLQSFGESAFSYNLSLTPFGSSEFLGLLFDASQTDQGLTYSIQALAFLLPAIFLFKLYLASATMSILQHQEMNVSKWLAEGGKHLFRALGLFLRWIFIPAIWIGLCALLFLVESDWLNKAAILLMVLGWFIALSWFYLALVVVVNEQKKSLRKAFKTLLRNKLYILLTIVVFATALALVNSMSILALVFEVNNTLLVTSLLAFFSALFLRIVIFFWQSSHVVMWRRDSIKLKNGRIGLEIG